MNQTIEEGAELLRQSCARIGLPVPQRVGRCLRLFNIPVSTKGRGRNLAVELCSGRSGTWHSNKPRSFNRVVVQAGRTIAAGKRVTRTIMVQNDDTLNLTTLDKVLKKLYDDVVQDVLDQETRDERRAKDQDAQVEVRDRLERLFPGLFRDRRFDGLAAAPKEDPDLRTYGEVVTKLGKVVVSVREGGTVDVKLVRTFLSADKAVNILTALKELE